MTERLRFLTKNFSLTINALKRLASPEGTSVKELGEGLSLNRRSVFRLLRGIETDLHIPVIVKRKEFGGFARYHLSESFTGSLSNISIPQMKLSFDEAVAAYLLAVTGTLYGEEKYGNFRSVRKIFESLGKKRRKAQND
jgi:predicted site-specific integrase-resolvase